jgi:hypothetical protein
MSSLQFLNKKSWHVNTRKNEEKVWLREQAAQKEAARVAELQKQLTEERKLEEIRRLQRESGNGEVSQSAPQIDWMYDGPGVAESLAVTAKREACLLGQKEAELPSKREEQNDIPVLATGNQMPSAERADSQHFPDDAPDSVVLREAEAKLREDPLLAIRRQQRESLERLSGRRVRGGLVKALSRPPSEPKTVNNVDFGEQRDAAKKTRKKDRARIRAERRSRRRLRDGEKVGDDEREHATAILGKRGRESVSELEVVENDGDLDKNLLRSSGGRSRILKYSGTEHEEIRAVERVDGFGRRRNSRWGAMAPSNPAVLGSSADLTACPERWTRLEGQSREGDRAKALNGLDDARGTRERFEPVAGHPSNDQMRGASRRRSHQIFGATSSADDRERRLAEMKRNADVIEGRRAVRVKLGEQDEIASRAKESFARGQHGQCPSFLNDFARNALDNSQVGRFSSSELRQDSNDFD